jgi:sulfide:quinone oxidoreductase
MSTRVLIAGGGVAGLEAAIALNELCGDRAEVEICSPRHLFVYRPFAVGGPYGTTQPLEYDLETLAGRCNAGFRVTSLSSVDTEQRLAVTPDGGKIPYDRLIVASGAKSLQSVPGAVIFWGTSDEPDVEYVIGRLDAGELRRLVFAMPVGHSWSLPMYELALLADSRRTEQGSKAKRTELTIVTPEEAPLGVFGPEASDAVGALLEERGIELITDAHPERFEHGVLSVVPDRRIEADAVVALPRMEGRRVAGIPHDEDGFVPVDEHSHVLGAEHAYAAGDVTSFPVKQGGIASQQADAAAEAIAAEVGVEIEPKPFDPTLRGVLWTGNGPRYLYSRLSGGHGETSMLTDQLPWQGKEGKIMSRYLSEFLSDFDRSGGRRVE